MPSFATKAVAFDTSAPKRRLLVIFPSSTSSFTSGVSVFSPLSRTTSASLPCRSPRTATVIAMRTAALSLAFSQG